MSLKKEEENDKVVIERYEKVKEADEALIVAKKEEIGSLEA